jgi:hypothetical protein
MYQAIREIQTAFEKADFHHDVVELGEKWALTAGVSGDQASYKFLFIKSDADDNDVAMRVMSIANFPNDRLAAAYKLVSELNSQYRFLRFVIDSDNDLNVEYDFPIHCDPIGPMAIELMIRTTQILDDCYPKVMRLIWA